MDAAWTRSSVSRRAVALAVLALLCSASPAVAQPPIDARSSYRAAIAAFDAGDERAYFDAFAPTLRCFYGSRDVPLSAIRRARLGMLARNRRRPGSHSAAIDRLDVVAADEHAAVLLDEGHDHAKAVLMVADAQRWRIAGEGGRSSMCYATLLRSETITGRDPLGTADEIYATLRRADDALRGPGGASPRWDVALADLTPPGMGVLQLRAPERWQSCDSTPPGIGGDFPRSALACDAQLERCSVGRYVFRFAERRGRRQLVAVIDYRSALPARESAEHEVAIADRDRWCELHDRIARADRTLATDDLWTLRGSFEGNHPPPRHACGAAARRASMRAIRAMSAEPLVCGVLSCHSSSDSNSDPHVSARREDGTLRLWIDGLEWISGDDVPAAHWRLVNERCRP